MPELLTDVGIYDKRFPQFERPVIVGSIGLENLKFARSVCSKYVHYNLNIFYDNAKHKNNEDVKLNDLIGFLYKHKTFLRYSEEKLVEDVSIFCYRGLLTCIACTPYENKEPWKIVAVLFKGCIFLCARNTEEKLNYINNMTEKEKLYTSWGHKFEHFVLSDSPNQEPNPHQPMDETKEFSLVLSTKLGKHRIIYGAEIDGVKCDQNCPPKPSTEDSIEKVNHYLSSKEFIELKTNRHIEFPNQERNFRLYKTKKWWCQSFLVGIDTILCGFRNDDGIVEELKVFKLKELHEMSEQFWKPNVCFNFLDEFLTYMKHCLVRKIKNEYGENSLRNLLNLPMITLMFEWRPKMPVQVATNYVYEDDPILPQWFIDDCNNYCNVNLNS